MTSPEPTPEPVTCDRCGALANVDWIDIRTLGDPGPRYVMGTSSCTTPGCVDDNGTTGVMPPDRPGQLTRDDKKWIDRQHRLADEFGRRIDRLLRESA